MIGGFCEYVVKYESRRPEKAEKPPTITLTASFESFFEGDFYREDFSFVIPEMGAYIIDMVALAAGSRGIYINSTDGDVPKPDEVMDNPEDFAAPGVGEIGVLNEYSIKLQSQRSEKVGKTPIVTLTARFDHFAWDDFLIENIRYIITVMSGQIVDMVALATGAKGIVVNNKDSEALKFSHRVSTDKNTNS